MENLRIHSNGYVFFQKNYPQPNGKYKNITLYLHKIIAEHFVSKVDSDKKLFVHIKNGNLLDLREDNLEWVTMADLRRRQKHRNKTGFRGVTQLSSNSFKATLYIDGDRVDIGVYKTAEEASEAYQEASEKLFGKIKKPVAKKNLTL
ncbi:MULTISPECIES: HNH endonuclease [Flammeovirga]|uniref:Pathogenesis-related transcriptional factor and ERF protein n=1 Tax=Flammeovirga agarivorans TaxID=2726742 RepID=A0A7X8SJF8_9BACT|nr:MULTISPECIES: HNH endonuclease [Flammeovirga]NLR91378.1 Pathogenesis-related transcriptional factor and ERF protein [Flammeovirga agarivorans]